MNLPCLCAFATAIVAAALLPSTASAQPILPPPAYDVLVATGAAANHFTSPGTYVLGGATIAVVAFPQPSLAGHAAGNPDVGAGFEGGISYSFTVAGPRDVVVPLFANFTLHANAIGSFATNASAQFQVSFTGNDFLERVDADTLHPTPADVGSTHPFGLEVGRIGHASLAIDGGSFSGFADAFVDPFIFVDPAFLASNPGYTVSGNAAPTAAVPEPETWALFLAGIAVLARSRLRAASRSRASRSQR
jgi:hypothetical protein